MTDRGGLSEAQARALWRRAAQLQAAAEQAAGLPALPAAEAELSLEQVAAAAEGAGIDAQFLHVALAEQQLPDAPDMRHEHWTGRWLQRLIREPHVFERERVIAAPPRVVYDIFRDVAARPTWQLVPENTVGRDPLRDAVMVYRAATGTDLSGALFIADARVLLVTLRPHERGTLMRIRVPLFRRGVNLFLAGLLGTLSAGGAGAATAAIAVPAGAAGIVLAAPLTVGMVAGGSLGVAAFRRLYRWSRGRGVLGIDMLLQAVAVEAEGRRPGG